MKPFICYTRPSITDLEIRYSKDAAANGWGEHCYDFITRFEKAFRDHLGVGFCIATSSATGALHMGMAALDIGPGDEVIMADTNWIATAAPVVHLGAKPVFTDILEDSWCIDPGLLEKAITPRTKAIIAVHLYGNVCNMSEILDIGDRYGIPVIEDAAEAIGSVYHGRRAGSMGHFGAFSFHGTKTITTGEGGMFVTSDSALYQKVLALSNHGRKPNEERQFWPEMVGFKYKMSNIQASIGCAQVERLDSLVTRKREILAYYREKLESDPTINMNPEPEGTINGAWMPTVVVNRGNCVDKLRDVFRRENIDARVFFHPLSSLPPFDNVPGNTVARRIAASAMNLPSFHDITEQEQSRVVEAVLAVARG